MYMKDFEIGVITKPQGIRGEMRVYPTTEDPLRFTLLVDDEVNIEGTPYKLTSARMQKSVVVIKLCGINDRNAAEAMAGKKILIPAEKALPLEKDEYFVRDLTGLCAETEDGEILGVLSEVLHTNANDVYVIKPARGESFMIPAIKDVVRNVSLTDGKITVRLIDGLR